LVARILAERLGATLNMRDVFVENRPGGGGGIAIQFVKGARPDGGTVLFTLSAPLTLGPLP
jgi:tripartite-type tricarboxylate transporter receptor subunit TctC